MDWALTSGAEEENRDLLGGGRHPCVVEFGGGGDVVVLSCQVVVGWVDGWMVRGIIRRSLYSTQS